MKHTFYKARLKTAGKTPEQIKADFEGGIGPVPTEEEVQGWIKAYDLINGIELVVVKSLISEGYIPVSWNDEDNGKIRDFVYQAEQDSFFGTYVNERDEFLEDWKSGEYSPDGVLTFDIKDVEILEEIKSMKVFKMNDCDHVCAENEQQAKEFYEKETGVSRSEIDEQFEGEVSLNNTMLINVDELPEDDRMITQLDMRKYGNELYVPKSFAWVIEHDKIISPCIICSTEY